MEKIIDYRIVGYRIRTERERLGITREKFSEMLELSSFYIGQIERGERKMSTDTLVRISLCLHVSLDYMIFGKEHTNNGNNELNLLIDKCSDKEAKVIEEVIKVILPYIRA